MTSGCCVDHAPGVRRVGRADQQVWALAAEEGLERRALSNHIDGLGVDLNRGHGRPQTLHPDLRFEPPDVLVPLDEEPPTDEVLDREYVGVAADDTHAQPRQASAEIGADGA